MIRPARPGDAAALAAIDRRVVAAGVGVVQTVGQSADEATYVGRIEDPSGDRILLVAEVDGAVVGEGTLTRLGVGSCRHVATLALHVDPDWQGRGLGRALVAALLDCGRALGIERTQLSVIADNQRAIGLYTSFGFAVEGCRSRFLLRDGVHVDDLQMVRYEAAPVAVKAAAIVVRGQEVLILVHPLAGWQLPKGTVAPGELPAEAVTREVVEETGLSGTVERDLGSWSVVVGRDLHRWHGFVVRAPPSAADRWEHAATGSPDEDGLVFELRWVRLDPWLFDVLPPRFHELVRRGLACR